MLLHFNLNEWGPTVLTQPSWPSSMCCSCMRCTCGVGCARCWQEVRPMSVLLAAPRLCRCAVARLPRPHGSLAHFVVLCCHSLRKWLRCCCCAALCCAACGAPGRSTARSTHARGSVAAPRRPQPAAATRWRTWSRTSPANASFARSLGPRGGRYGPGAARSERRGLLGPLVLGEWN